jgi:lipoyl(octanoyl) transferase
MPPTGARFIAIKRGMFRVIDLGSDVSYDDGLAAMRDAMARVDDDGPALVLIEHRPTITITQKGGTGAFVSPRAAIEADGIAVAVADRGGDVTFHGPGQLTGYPVLRLGPTSLGCDVVGYVRALEQAIVDVVKGCGVESARALDGKDAAGHFLTGVWAEAAVVDDETLGCDLPTGRPEGNGLHVVERQPQKVCAIGVGLGGGVTRHGFALNVTTALECFTKHIVPCGIQGAGVTSLDRLLPRTPRFDDVKAGVVVAVNARLGSWHQPAPAAPARTGS